MGGFSQLVHALSELVQAHQLQSMVLPASNETSAAPTNLTDHASLSLSSDASSSDVARFTRSYHGKSMIIYEPAPVMWSARGFLVLIVVLQSIAMMLQMGKQWRSMARGMTSGQAKRAARASTVRTKSSSIIPASYFHAFLAWSFVNLFFHGAHYADNIWLPVDYCEPEWLYRAYLFTPMEITGAFFTPLCWVAWKLVRLTLHVAQENYVEQSQTIATTSRSLWHIALVSLGICILSGAHYAIEPPSSYPLRSNITIMGEVIAGFMLLWAVWRVDVSINSKRAASTASTDVQMAQYSRVDSQ